LPNAKSKRGIIVSFRSTNVKDFFKESQKMTGYVLGIDNGSTVAKAAIFSISGDEVACAARKIPLSSPQVGYSEVDMEILWQLTAEAIREAMDSAGLDGSAILGVACTGHGNGLYLVDEDGRPVRPAIRGADTRAREYIDRWLADGVDVAIRPKTMQAIWPAQPNALLAWMREYEPESLERAVANLTVTDFIRLRLTGQLGAELTNQSGTSLMNVGTGQYDIQVLEAFGIPEMQRLLPPLRRSAEVCGAVTPTASGMTGLAVGTPVAGGLFDIDACGLASGLVDESQLCMIAGTWGNNQYISKQPVVHQDVFMTTRYAIDGYYLMLEGSATSASNLEWFVTEFFEAERKQAEAAGDSVYEICNRLVAETEPAQTGIVFLPFLYGSNVSLDGKACFFGLDGWQSRGHVLRAIYEGIIFSHHWHLDRLLQFRSLPGQIRLSGGAARSTVWLQMFADILQVPVEVPSGTELGALGAAIAASVAAGCYPSLPSACQAMVRIERCCEPNPKLASLYREKYGRYQRLLQVLAPVWSELAWKQGEGSV
jgi:L-xylulokinase